MDKIRVNMKAWQVWDIFPILYINKICSGQNISSCVLDSTSPKNSSGLKYSYPSHIPAIYVQSRKHMWANSYKK